MRLNLVLCVALLSYSCMVKAEPIPNSKLWIAPYANDYGFSAAKLNRIVDLYKSDIRRGTLPGANLLIMRKGKTIMQMSIGYRDLSSKIPLQYSDLFRIYSMTKPMATALSFVQIQQGRYTLDSPIRTYLPEVSNLKVLTAEQPSALPAKGVANKAQIYAERPQTHDINIRHLLSHTSGFSATWFDDEISKRYIENGVVEYQPHDFPYSPSSLEDFYTRILRVPLAHQPGAKRTYGVSNDVQGVLIQRASGQPLEQFLKLQLLNKLNMHNTGFCVTNTQRPRLVSLYRVSANMLKQEESGATSAYLCPVAMPSLSGGLVSNVEDYRQFAEMLSNGGLYKRIGILSSAHAALMGKAQPGIDEGDWIPGADWGLGMAIVTDPQQSLNKEYLGNYYWSGSAGTTFWIDPTHNIIAILFIQVRDPQGTFAHSANVRNRVYEAFGAK